MGANTSPLAQNYLKALWNEASSGPVIWDNLTWGQAINRRRAAHAVRARERKASEAAGPLAWDAIQITIIKSEEFPGMYALRFAPDHLNLPGEIRTEDGQKLKYDPKLMSLVPAETETENSDSEL